MTNNLVIKNTGSSYWVLTPMGEIIDCRVKGNFRIKGIRSTNPVAVGDWVDIVQQPDGTAWITSIVDRRNYIIRRSTNLSKQSHIIAANIDLAALVITVNYPETSLIFIDRFLAAAEAYRILSCLIFNKIDRYNNEEIAKMQQYKTLYNSLGYQVFCVSALHNIDLQLLKQDFRGKTVLLSGNSGVGKSTLLNAITDSKLAKTAEISTAHNKGMHTTTFSEMYALTDGGWLIDTPGIKGFGTFDMEKTEVGHYFKEIFEISHQCRFGNCTHHNEPGCAVLEALDNNKLAISRYQSYLSMLNDCDERKYR